MAGSIRGITIEIEGKTDGLVKSLDSVNKQLKDTQGQLKTVEKAMKLDPTNLDLVVTHQQILNTAIAETKQKLELEKKAAEDAKQALALGKITTHEYNTLQAEVSKTEAELFNLGEQSKQDTNILNEMGGEVVDVGHKFSITASDFADFGANVANALGGAISMLGEFSAAVAGVAFDTAKALASATAQLVSQSIEGYAQLEQMEGGLDKLYGSSAQKVIRNAEEAYLNAGMSAEEYMSTATSISATIIKDMDGDLASAADMTDEAIRAMADNASVFGTDLNTVQSAFVGFSRGNFQMLDSLSLGYAGTKEGMVQLINDSGILEEKIENLDGISFSQMIEAINAVQTDMGIAGNAADEVLSTLSGSIGATENAWQNFVTGLSDPNADIGQLIDNLVTTGLAALDNLVPAIKQALESISEALPIVAQVLEENLPDIIDSALPLIVTGISTLVKSIGSVLPSLVNTLADNAGELIQNTVPSLLAAVQVLITAVLGQLPALLEILKEQLPYMLTLVMNALVANIDVIIETVQSLIDVFLTAITDNLEKILEGGVKILTSLIGGLMDTLPEVIPVIMDCIDLIVTTLLTPENIKMLIDSAVTILTTIAEGISSVLPDLIPVIVEAIVTITTELTNHSDELIEAALEIILALAEGLVAAIPDLLESIPEIISSIIEAFADLGTDLYDNALEWMADFGAGIVDGIKGFLDDAAEAASGVAETIASYLHFSRPDKGPLRYYEEWMPDFMEGLSTGIEDNIYKLKASAGDVAMTLEAGVNAVDYSGSLNNISDTLTGMAQGGNQPIVVYIGDEKLGSAIARANSRTAFISGGI